MGCLVDAFALTAPRPCLWGLGFVKWMNGGKHACFGIGWVWVRMDWSDFFHIDVHISFIGACVVPDWHVWHDMTWRGMAWWIRNESKREVGVIER